jgi:1-acyl-sn-glycerol-3-phosphate acyltransferase
MKRPDLLSDPKAQLSRTERAQIAAIRRTFEPGRLDEAIRWCQRTIGSTWITTATSQLRHVHRLDRLPPMDPTRSYILVCNHRSFFDLYVVTGDLVKRGLRHRLMFPVRSEFFYDRALGFFVNGVMSFFAMYPPIFRDRQRAALNLLGLDETVWMLRRGGCFLGIHPEGTRKLDDDPYTLLPAQSGVGRIVHHAGVAVIPVFINGLVNHLPTQIKSNFDGSGRPIHIVFGEPIDFGDLLSRPGSPRVYRAIAERTVEAIATLGQEEREYRARAGH